MKRDGSKVVFVWIPRERHIQLKESAARNEMSVSELVKILIGQHLSIEHNGHLKKNND